MTDASDPRTAVLPRYRVEDGQHCVDLRVSSAAQLFDNRDPAPFRERDLDPALVEYLMDAAEDLASAGGFRLVFWFPSPPSGDDVVEAVRGHFEYERQRLERGRHRQRRTGQVALLVAIALLVALRMLAEILTRLPGGSVRDAVKEGLVIFSWVVLWRPVDVLFYEWLPVRRQRKVIQSLLDAPIDLRVDEGRPAAT